MTSKTKITVGELAVRFLEECGVRAAFGVISIHNMPILDAFHVRNKIRFVSARGEAGACNMADSYARIVGGLGVCVTSTGTGAGNAAGALVEAMTAGTPMLHLTGQIESPFLDRDLGFIHEAPQQVAMLKACGKEAFRIRNPETALATLREAVRLAQTPPCGPVSIEIPIDIQKAMIDLPADMLPIAVLPVQPSMAAVDELAAKLVGAKRPLLMLGGGARGTREAVERFVKMGWGVVTSVQGRGIIPEDSDATLGSFSVQKPSEELYGSIDAMLAVGTRLRSNETLNYHLKLPTNIYRIDANVLAHNRGYESQYFVHGDALVTLNALADRLEGKMAVDKQLHADIKKTREASSKIVDGGLAKYVALKDGLNEVLKGEAWWVRDITLSNSMWGNRSLVLDNPRAGVHALGGGIGQGLAMGIGASIANTTHELGRKTVTLIGDGGFMLNAGELACAAQEKADMLMIVMNDGGYGVIKNIQDDIYGSRHCYVDLHTPDFSMLCGSLKVKHLLLDDPAKTKDVITQALGMSGPVMVEVDMKSWGPFAIKFAGPPKKKD